MALEGARRPLRDEDILAVRWLADVAVSPDGSRIACVERRVDPDAVRSRILVVAAHDGEARSPSPDDAVDEAPRWLGHGSRLAFLAGRPDAAGPWTCDATGSAAAPWPGCPPGVTALAPSPDGEALALVVAADDAPAPEAPLWEVTGPGWQQDAAPTVERRTRSGLVRVDADGRCSALTRAPGVRDRAPAWSPDGRRVAFLSDRPTGSSVTGLWAVPADGSAPPSLLVAAAAIGCFAWAPDGRAIAWLGHREAPGPGAAARLWVTDIGAGGTREVPLPDLPAPGAAVRSDDPRGMGDATLAWTAAGRLWLRWAAGGASRLGWVDPASARVTTVVEGERAVLAFGVAAAAPLVAHVTATADHPGELAVCAPDGSGERTLTDRNDWLRDVELGPTRPVRATGTGGLPIEGWVVEPPASVGRTSGGHPVVVSVHGGPHYPIGWRFSLEAHRLAARGYAVLAGNARGSTGYGDAFAAAIAGDWGGGDLGDTHALLDAAIATGGLDASRLAITGVSYGGYLTMWAVSQGDRFRAAIAENGISDLLSAFGSAQDDGSFWVAELGGAPWEAPDAYVGRSPLLHAHRITTPLLLLHAEEDHNCPIAQSEELFAALLRLGRPARFLRARGVGHLMNFTGSGAFRLARARAIDDWLDRWLGPLPTDDGAGR